MAHMSNNLGRQMPGAYQMVGYLLIHGPSDLRDLVADNPDPPSSVAFLARLINANLVNCQRTADSAILTLTDRIQELLSDSDPFSPPPPTGTFAAIIKESN